MCKWLNMFKISMLQSKKYVHKEEIQHVYMRRKYRIIPVCIIKRFTWMLVPYSSEKPLQNHKKFLTRGFINH